MTLGRVGSLQVRLFDPPRDPQKIIKLGKEHPQMSRKSFKKFPLKRTSDIEDVSERNKKPGATCSSSWSATCLQN